MTKLDICVVGLGYIGLPTATVLATRGLSVLGVDTNPNTVSLITAGSVHIVEPGLEALVSEVVASGKLRAALTPEPADAFIIAVPTPFREDHEPDLQFVEQAVRTIAPVLSVGDVIILESTSPVGTTEMMAQWLAEERADLSFPRDVAIAYCPERVLPGQILKELVENDRVIGGLTTACAQAATRIYATFVTGRCVQTDARTAELCKLSENSFRDVNIAFANELSIICDRLGINVWELIKLTNLHPRVNVLQPGPGVGGHCIAVDPWFIVHSAPDEARLIRQARLVNDSKPDWVVERIKNAVARLAPGRSDKLTIACLGLAFKPDIDDLRGSPALDICVRLTAIESVKVIAVEPYIQQLPDILAEKAELRTADDAIASADIVVLLVDHTAFRQIPYGALAGRELLDTRGVWSDRPRGS